MLFYILAQPADCIESTAEDLEFKSPAAHAIFQTNKQRSKLMKKHLITLFAVTALVLAGCSGPSPDAPGVAVSAEDNTTSLVGEWGYSSDTFSFEAEVESGDITIYIILDDNSKGLYWTGTFPESAEDGESITSKADVEALTASLYGSSDEEKTFEFSDNKLNYEFTIMGTLTDVSLEKQ